MTNVQYGCGWSAPPTWTNFDASPTLRFERLPVVGSVYTKNERPFPSNVRYGDVVTGLPVDDHSVSVLYCSHVLEHLSLEDASTAIANSFSVLRPGGIWRIVVPDLRSLAESYLTRRDPAAAIDFLRSTRLGREGSRRSLRQRLRDALGNADHQWMWDYESLSAALQDAGFVEIRRATLGDSGIADFTDVEDADRWKGALGVQCQRPEPQRGSTRAVAD